MSVIRFKNSKGQPKQVTWIRSYEHLRASWLISEKRSSMGSSYEAYASNVNVSNSISLLPCATSLYIQHLDISLNGRYMTYVNTSICSCLLISCILSPLLPVVAFSLVAHFPFHLSNLLSQWTVIIALQVILNKRKTINRTNRNP
jgi:hypothetical protein